MSPTKADTNHVAYSKGSQGIRRARGLVLQLIPEGEVQVARQGPIQMQVRKRCLIFPRSTSLRAQGRVATVSNSDPARPQSAERFVYISSCGGGFGSRQDA